MKRALVVAGVILLLIIGSAYLLNNYWTHRFDSLIDRQASIYRIDPDLVWSIIYEETYFSPWKTGKDGEKVYASTKAEVGTAQVDTPEVTDAICA